MKSHDLRQLNADELTTKVEALREDLFKVRFEHATQQLSNTAKVQEARRTLARALTILGEKRRDADQQG